MLLLESNCQIFLKKLNAHHFCDLGLAAAQEKKAKNSTS